MSLRRQIKAKILELLPLISVTNGYSMDVKAVWDKYRSVADLNKGATPVVMLIQIEIAFPETSAGRRGRIGKIIVRSACKGEDAGDDVLDLQEDVENCLQNDWTLDGLISKCIALRSLTTFMPTMAWADTEFELYWSEVKTP